MPSQHIWIGIAIGACFAGIGIGYAVFVNTYNPYSIMTGNPTIFSQMMGKNPQFSGQYMGYMMQNPQYMNQWMSQNPQYMGQWMGSMMQDPTLRNQMYNYMFQNQPFMQGMLQNQQFQQQYMPQYSSNSQTNYTSQQGQNIGSKYGQGYQMGPGMMNGGYGQAFKTIAIKDASSQLPSDAQIVKDTNTITFSSSNVSITALSMMADDAKNMTGSSLPQYANDDTFVIGNMIDPTLVIKPGTSLSVTSINLDEDMSHNFVITTSAPPYSYMPMHSMMNGGTVSMMPVLPNDDVKAGYAYEQSYQITLSQPGTYWYVCTYPGHAEQGMYGKIIVK